MPRVLVTGMSGTGKSSVLDILRSRGHIAVDTDYDGWTLRSGRWNEERMRRLLDEHPDLVVSGAAENQGTFYGSFEHIVLLSAPIEVVLERIAARSNNPYGKSDAQRSAIAHHFETVEPLLRRSATVELDARLDPDEIADAVEALIRAAR